MAMLRRAAAAALLFGLAGCGGGPVKVAGKVVYDDGRPATDLAGGGVIFTSDNGKDMSSGDITSDGRFVLSYRTTGDGAMPGTYKVAVQPNDPGWETDAARLRGTPVPMEYTDPEKTPLTVTIDKRTDDLTLTVPRKAKK